MKTTKKGFTLIELLVVIGILAILLTIVLIAINPARQFAQANNTKRRSDVTAILNAIHQYAADNKGNLTPMGLSSTPTDITDGVGGASSVCALIMPTYISALPMDPSLANSAPITNCASYDSGYAVAQDSAGRITVSTLHAQIPEASATSITITR